MNKHIIGAISAAAGELVDLWGSAYLMKFAIASSWWPPPLAITSAIVGFLCAVIFVYNVAAWLEG